MATATGAQAAPETDEHRYARETRNAVMFIAVIVGIVFILSLVGVIITAVQLSKLNTQLNGLNGGSTSISNCYSQGGTDLSC